MELTEGRENVEISELAELADDEQRRTWFSSRPQLVHPELAWRLAEESNRSLRVDLGRAEALAATACWLAERAGDAAARARSLRAAANVLMYQRRYAPALELYDEALSVFHDAGDEIEAAITRSNAIGSLSHLARYDDALAFAAAARRTFERHDDLRRLGVLEVNVAHVLSRQDRFVEAIERYRRARALFEEVGRPSDVAITLRNIAVCYQDLNDFHASLEAYSVAREYCREHGLTLVGLEVEYNIAYIYYLRGEYGQAIRLFEKARRHCQENDDPHHAALCDLDLAEIFLELNLVRDAQHLAERSYQAFCELGMEYEAAKGLVYQALAAARSDRTEPAVELLRRARRLFERQDNRVWVAMIELHTALILFGNDRLEEAVGHAEAAYASFRDAGVPSRTAVCRILRARLCTGLGDLDEAARHSAAALELAREAGRPLLEFQAHLVIGQTAEARGDQEAALASYRHAHEALERLRGQLQTDELKIAFAHDKQAVYEGLVAVTLAERQSAAEIEQALLWVETAKSRSLTDLLASGSGGIGRPAGTDNPLVDRLRELRQELSWYYRQIGAEELKGGESSKRRLGELRQGVVERERQLLRTLRRLQASDVELSSLQGSFLTDLGRLRELLPADSVLVEYFVARGLLYRFRIDLDRLEVRPLCGVAELQSLYRQLQFQFGKFRVGGDYVQRFAETFRGHAQSLLERLHAALLGDLELGSGVRHLIVVPHDFLHHVPFHALHDGERYLIDRLSVSYSPSATVFELCAGRRIQTEERSLVLGVPDERAPKILEEAQTVAEILPNSKLLIGEEATRDSLSRLANGCRFVHIATHGLYRKDNPMFSALQLGDTRLSLLDLYDLQLQVELAVLSGCGTGLSDVQGSDELVGLTRGLLFAGARSVLATLWDVNDDSTAELMSHFYRRLEDGSNPSTALQNAMLTLREAHPHPYYWAPFVLTGRP